MHVKNVNPPPTFPDRNTNLLTNKQIKSQPPKNKTKSLQESNMKRVIIINSKRRYPLNKQTNDAYSTLIMPNNTTKTGFDAPQHVMDEEPRKIMMNSERTSNRNVTIKRITPSKTFIRITGRKKSFEYAS